MFKSFAQIGRKAAEGDVHFAYPFKLSIPAPGTVGFFVDTNQTAGIPRYNAFAGSALTATPLVGSGNNGLFCGVFNPGSSKHLLRWQMTQVQTTNGAPDNLFLNDYLMFYPLIDCGDDSTQIMDNSLSLPRYTNGEGVRIVLIATAPVEGTTPVTITYTNSQGVSGRTATANILQVNGAGICATGAGTGTGAGFATPFFPLDNGDSGVRSIDSITLGAAVGGFVVACLVKPLANLTIYESLVPSEKQYGIENQMLPEIQPGAYLNFIIQRGASQTGNYRGELIFINS